MLPNIEDDQARLLMFENGELDVMRVDRRTYEGALDPGHPFNPMLYVSPFGGLWYIKMKIDFAPLEDLLVRRALAHGVDMESIVRAIWGPTATHAKGLFSSLVPCHNPTPTISRTTPTSLGRICPSRRTADAPSCLCS